MSDNTCTSDTIMCFFVCTFDNIMYMYVKICIASLFRYCIVIAFGVNGKFCGSRPQRYDFNFYVWAFLSQ